MLTQGRSLRTAWVRLMQGLRSFRLTGNTSPSLVSTSMSAWDLPPDGLGLMHEHCLEMAVSKT